jgi:protein O-GlcNAc transferase
MGRMVTISYALHIVFGCVLMLFSFLFHIQDLFYLSFYYRANVALVASQYYQLAITVWPKLHYISKRALQYQQHQQYDGIIPPTNNSDGITSSVNDDTVNRNNNMKNRTKEIVQRKIRLGIVSPNLSVKNSVVEDFKGTMSRLDRSKFDITYIFIQEGRKPDDNIPDPFIHEHYPRDKLLVLQQDKTIDIANGAWVTRWHSTIENLQFDILFYLDLTMGCVTTRLAMSKLAPVQAVSHGHPVTSGIHSSIMDYYISWGLAELEYDIANTHYTEELKLLPTKSIHQYYTPRATEISSLINGVNYRTLVNAGRDKAFPTIPSTGHWYTCMQKPFKLFPDMDALICGILQKDTLGHVILHGAATEPQQIFMNRLLVAGCDMTRVHFLGAQPHHQLLALYALSDVILDSYPAGGCTTTREVLAIGKALITLPARLLGGRWSYAYYQIMGDEILNSLVIAKNATEYITMAVTLGTSLDIRMDVERRIKNSVHALYEREDSVKAWNEVFLDISPVIIDDNYYHSTNGAMDKDEL